MNGNSRSSSLDLRLMIVVIATLLMTCASIFYSSTDYLPAHEVGALDADRGDSDYRKITVWGAPLPFVTDMLSSEDIGQIDGRNCFSGGAFLGDWLSWFLASWPLSFMVPSSIRFFFRFVREIARPSQEN